MISLNSEEFDPELSSIDGGNAYHMNQVSSLHREIAMLQDQVHELQSVYFDKLLNQTIHSKSKKFSKRCLNEIDFGIKASKTDALNGRSYVSERHVPSFTRFDMWHQYYVDSVDSETVKDKLNGLQRVSILLLSIFCYLCVNFQIYQNEPNYHCFSASCRISNVLPI